MSVMVLAQKDREIVTEHIRKAFPMLLELSSSNVTSLCYQREILEKIIHQMDKRFEELVKRQIDALKRQIDALKRQIGKLRSHTRMQIDNLNISYGR